MSDTARVEALARGDVRRERSRREIFWCAAGDRRRLGEGTEASVCLFVSGRTTGRGGRKDDEPRAAERKAAPQKEELGGPARAYYAADRSIIHRC